MIGNSVLRRILGLLLEVEDALHALPVGFDLRQMRRRRFVPHTAIRAKSGNDFARRRCSVGVDFEQPRRDFSKLAAMLLTEGIGHQGARLAQRKRERIGCPCGISQNGFAR